MVHAYAGPVPRGDESGLDLQQVRLQLLALGIVGNPRGIDGTDLVRPPSEVYL